MSESKFSLVRVFKVKIKLTLLVWRVFGRDELPGPALGEMDHFNYSKFYAFLIFLTRNLSVKRFQTICLRGSLNVCRWLRYDWNNEPRNSWLLYYHLYFKVIIVSIFGFCLESIFMFMIEMPVIYPSIFKTKYIVFNWVKTGVTFKKRVL